MASHCQIFNIPSVQIVLNQNTMEHNVEIRFIHTYYMCTYYTFYLLNNYNVKVGIIALHRTFLFSIFINLFANI